MMTKLRNQTRRVQPVTKGLCFLKLPYLQSRYTASNRASENSTRSSIGALKRVFLSSIVTYTVTHTRSFCLLLLALFNGNAIAATLYQTSKCSVLAGMKMDTLRKIRSLKKVCTSFRKSTQRKCSSEKCDMLEVRFSFLPSQFVHNRLPLVYSYTNSHGVKPLELTIFTC